MFHVVLPPFFNALTVAQQRCTATYRLRLVKRKFIDHHSLHRSSVHPRHTAAASNGDASAMHIKQAHVVTHRNGHKCCAIKEQHSHTHSNAEFKCFVVLYAFSHIFVIFCFAIKNFWQCALSVHSPLLIPYANCTKCYQIAHHLQKSEKRNGKKCKNIMTQWY